MPRISRARIPSKKNPPDAGLPLFDWHPPAPAPRTPVHIAARRIAERVGIPFTVALAHAEAAGLSQEAR